MKHNLLITVAAVAVATAAIIFPAVSAAQTPKMGGGYKDVIAIPVDDPATKAIAGVLFKPAGAGPFPAVIYMAPCVGVNLDTYMQAVLRDRLLAKGVALLIVDSFWPRQEWLGVCEKSQADGSYSAREARDIYAALDVLKARPEIDANRIFAQGYSLGASGALAAIDSQTAAAHATKLAGVIAFYPDCGASTEPSAPALILIGEKDDWTPSARCQALSGKPNVDVVVYPGAVHAFAVPGVDTEMFGHRVLYDHHAAEDAQARADAFLDAHAKEVKTQ
jgi:dienelactone hydrolase